MSVAELRANVQKASLEIFGEALLFTPAGHPQRTVQAKFLDAYDAVELLGEQAEAQAPMVKALASDVPEAAHGDQWHIHDEDYVVVEVRLDEHGFALMPLRLE